MEKIERRNIEEQEQEKKEEEKKEEEEEEEEEKDSLGKSYVHAQQRVNHVHYS